jgi:hypothetical protein
MQIRGDMTNHRNMRQRVDAPAQSFFGAPIAPPWFFGKVERPTSDCIKHCRLPDTLGLCRYHEDWKRILGHD